MKLSSIIKTTFRNITRQKFLTYASVNVMLLIFLLSNIFLGALYFTYKINIHFEKQFSNFIFFTHDCRENKGKIDELIEKLKAKNLSRELIYHSSKEVHGVIYDEAFKNDPLILKNKPEDPCSLGSQLEIRANDINSAKLINQFLTSEKEKGNYPIYSISFAYEQALVIQSLLRILQISILVFISFLALTVYLITSLSIELSIRSRSDEIGIMELVGARKRQIRSIFILEGAVYGLIGAFIASLLFLGLYAYLYGMRADNIKIDEIFTYLRDIGIPEFNLIKALLFVVAESLIGLTFGAFNHYLSLRKYL